VFESNLRTPYNKMVASFNLVPGQQYHIRLNSSTPSSSHGFAWRSVRMLAPPGVNGRIELVDLSDPIGPREKSPYVANIIQVEGQSTPKIPPNVPPTQCCHHATSFCILPSSSRYRRCCLR
jgi:hypothetical protein